MKKKSRIAILQPEVPHYREDFFSLLRRECESMDIYVYNSFTDAKSNGFYVEAKGVKYIANKQIHGFLLNDPLVLLNSKYDTLVLMLHFAHITTWLLLLTKFIHKKKIILYGQGISVKRYLKEEKKPDWKLKLMIALADGAWVYMDKEYQQWHQLFPKKEIIALGNTISGIKEIMAYKPTVAKDVIKEKYGMREEVLLIFCARFTSPYRRVDLLVETIKRLDKKRFGFIIIGDGENKPDFTSYSNVHDFGAVYDTTIKKDLFSAADIYFQPGWVGLSIVEAMAYGLPIFTFKRTEETKQCVEYNYIESGKNGLLFEHIDDCVDRIKKISSTEIKLLGENAKHLAGTLTAEKMADNAMSVINKL